MKQFFDTNILVYLFDTDAPSKRKRARTLFERCASDGTLLLSTQVLQEFYVTVTRKLARPLPPDEALAAVEELSRFPVVAVDVVLVHAAIRRHQSDRISFWDALIVESALAGGASALYSEDLQSGRSHAGLRIVDPFS